MGMSEYYFVLSGTSYGHVGILFSYAHVGILFRHLLK